MSEKNKTITKVINMLSERNRNSKLNIFLQFISYYKLKTDFIYDNRTH